MSSLLKVFSVGIRHAIAIIAVTSICFLAGCGGGGSGSGGGGTGGSGGGGGTTATMTLTVNPWGLAIYPGGTFSVVVTASVTGTQATPSITLGSLPSGITTTATFPMSVPAAGAVIPFAASSAVSPGNYTIPISGAASTATASTSEPLTVNSGTPAQAYFAIPQFTESEVAQGGSLQLQLGTSSNGSSYDITLGAEGLPAGVTATFNPIEVLPGQSFTVTLHATAGAPLAQNVTWSVTGLPAANAPALSMPLLLDVVASNSVGWSNQTSYVSTRATPSAAVYDPAHQLIYASNRSWNEVDIISDKTRAIVGKLSIRDPEAIDISPDGSKIWVGTGSQVVYAIDTGTQKMTRYLLPRFGVTTTSSGSSWECMELFSLADGTLLIEETPNYNSGIEGAAIWNPVTNALTQLTGPAPWNTIARSGDGKKVFSIGPGSFSYSVTTGTFSAAVPIAWGKVASNVDGSKIAVQDAVGVALYDGNLNRLGTLLADAGENSSVFDGFVFSPDGSKLYLETESTIVPAILTFGTSNLQLLSVSPAMPVIPVMVELDPPYYIPNPFAVDTNGMLLGVQYEGIAFDDATVNMNYTSADPAPPTFLQHANVYSGPLAGGTAVSGFGNAFSITPDAYFGAAKGTASLSTTSLTITSPPAQTPGPVDVKILFPDGIEIFNPQFFTYGTRIQNAIVSGGPPQGGAPANLSAWGLPSDPSSDQVSIGGNAATVTSKPTQYPPLTNEQTAMYLTYTTPSGAPGWADLTVTTPNSSDTLHKGFFFAKSVTDYAMSDKATFVLYDPGRNQLYLSAGNHIDVFSLSSNSFTSALQPPAVGAVKQFEGLALTPDGKYLLAADLTDDSIAAIDPDSPANAYAVKVASGGWNPGLSCPTGPLFVAADNLGNAYAVTGGDIGAGCQPGGYEAVVNLAGRTSKLLTNLTCNVFGQAGYLTAFQGGALIAFGGTTGYGGFQLYSPAKGQCIPSVSSSQPGIAASADGNLMALHRTFVDASGSALGSSAYPGVLYPDIQDPALQNPQLNAAGSLYYWAYPNYVDILDVQHGTPALRMGLTETVTNTVAPLAIDSSGQHIYLITNKGLTAVDLGEAPLSVGHMSQQAGSVGTQIQIRGSGFEQGITATLGGTPAMVSYQDSETLTLTVPAASSGTQDLVLTNPDGTTYTLQSAVTVQ